jgi:predicted phage terminase large subunit-like protein
LSLSPSVAAEHLLMRRKARQEQGGLIPYAQYTMPGPNGELTEYRPGRLHEVAAEKLESVLSGETRRLLIKMPPRRGKSELTTKRFATWVMGQRPWWHIMLASYGGELATDFSYEAREIVRSRRFQRVFPGLELVQDSRRRELWRILAEGESKQGQFLAAGVTGRHTGYGANLFIIDDPIKTAEEALSQTYRQKVWSWYLSVARTRLMHCSRTDHRGAIVLAYTQWHEDDLGGRLLDRMVNAEGEHWEVLHIREEWDAKPCICCGKQPEDPLERELGELAWEERYDRQDLEETKAALKDQGEWWYQALYQGNPIPEGGNVFKKEWVDAAWYDPGELPRGLHYYAASDYAVSEEDGSSDNDYTVHVVAGLDRDNVLWLVDLWRERSASDVWVQSAVDLMLSRRPMRWYEEAGQINKGVGPWLVKEMRRRRAVCVREQMTSAVNKRVRAATMEAMLSSGQLRFPRRAPWAPELEQELLRFPKGTHDDQVDALSLLCRGFDEMVAPTTTPLPTTAEGLTRTIG